MDEDIKKIAIVILAILNVIFLVALAGSCANYRLQKTSRDKEMFKRLDFEEKLSKVAQEKDSLETRAKVLSKDLEDQRRAHEADKKELNDTRDELAKVTKLKEALEENLKEALMRNKSSKNMR